MLLSLGSARWRQIRWCPGHEGHAMCEPRAVQIGGSGQVSMIRRFSSLIIVLAVLLASTLSSGSAQDASVGTALDAPTPPDPSAGNSAFSDGDLPLLHAIWTKPARCTYTPAARVIEQPSAGDFTKNDCGKNREFRARYECLVRHFRRTNVSCSRRLDRKRDGA